MKIEIPLKNMKVAHCAICGRYIGSEPALIWFKLSNNSIMAQPSCHEDIEKHKQKEYQRAILHACRQVWKKEILESKTRTDEEKVSDLENMMSLEIV